MSFLISDAYAAAPVAASPAQAGGFNTIIMMGVFVLVLYFIMLRPQQKRAKQQRDMLTSLAKGDEIITGGGLLGKITHIGEQFITVSIAETTEIKIQKSAVAAVVPKGTMKSA
jgi:preprotein translocase subunit YajC